MASRLFGGLDHQHRLLRAARARARSLRAGEVVGSDGLLEVGVVLERSTFFKRNGWRGVEVLMVSSSRHEKPAYVLPCLPGFSVPPSHPLVK